jgi:hypothetical protein
MVVHMIASRMLSNNNSRSKSSNTNSSNMDKKEQIICDKTDRGEFFNDGSYRLPDCTVKMQTSLGYAPIPPDNFRSFDFDFYLKNMFLPKIFGCCFLYEGKYLVYLGISKNNPDNFIFYNLNCVNNDADCTITLTNEQFNDFLIKKENIEKMVYGQIPYYLLNKQTELSFENILTTKAFGYVAIQGSELNSNRQKYQKYSVYFINSSNNSIEKKYNNYDDNLTYYIREKNGFSFYGLPSASDLTIVYFFYNNFKTIRIKKSSILKIKGIKNYLNMAKPQQYYLGGNIKMRKTRQMRKTTKTRQMRKTKKNRKNRKTRKNKNRK